MSTSYSYIRDERTGMAHVSWPSVIRSAQRYCRLSRICNVDRQSGVRQVACTVDTHPAQRSLSPWRETSSTPGPGRPVGLLPFVQWGQAGRTLTTLITVK